MEFFTFKYGAPGHCLTTTLPRTGNKQNSEREDGGILAGAQLRTDCAWPAPLSQKYQAMLVDWMGIPAQDVKKSDLKTTERIEIFFVCGEFQ
jgi:hypothetical protein